MKSGNTESILTSSAVRLKNSCPRTSMAVDKRIIATKSLRTLFIMYITRHTPFLLSAISQVDAIVLFYLAHDEGAFDGRETLYLAKFVEDKLLVLLHIAGAYL